MKRLRACLDELPPRQARVLSLRAGIGKRGPLTVAQTARSVGMRMRQVRRIERRALHHLKRAARDGCGTARASEPAPDGSGAFAAPAVATGSASTALADAGSGSGSAVTPPQPAGGPSGSGTSQPHGGVKGEQRKHRAAPRHFPSVLLPHDRPLPPILLLIPVVAAAIWFAISRIRRRRRIDRLRYY